MKKTAENSSFKPEQEVKVKGIDLAMTNMSTDMLLGNMGAFVLPLKYRWIDKDGEPTTADAEGAKAIFDPNSTYNSNNFVEALVFKSTTPEQLEQEFAMFQNVIELKRRLNDILEKAVENGETTLISEIQAELSKTRTEVVE